jgi:DNA-binding MarR family transcriptional regulator
MGNILHNTDMIENYERRIQVEKLTPLGREILETYIPVRVDERTIKLVKLENLSLEKKGKVSRKRKEKDNRK